MKLTKLEISVLKDIAQKPTARLFMVPTRSKATMRLSRKGAVDFVPGGWGALYPDATITPAGRAYLATLDAKEAEQ